MQSSLIQIAGHEVTDEYENQLSFGPLIEYLKTRLKEKQAIKSEFYRFVLERFEKECTLTHKIDPNRVEEYRELLELVYTILTPLAADEKEFAWALSTPIPEKIFYSTEAFYTFITNHNAREASGTSTYHPLENKQQKLIYRLVLERFYNFIPAIDGEIIYNYTDPVSGTIKYYRIHTDTQFIDIKAKGKLPELNFDLIGTLIYEGKEVELLSKVLPLSYFSFEGFSVITLKDITLKHAISNIRTAIVNHADEKTTYRETINALKTLAANNSIKFGLLPFLTINDTLVFNSDECSQSILMNSARKMDKAENIFYALVEKYREDPKPIFIGEITDDKIAEHPFMEALRQNGVVSYCVLPVYHSKNLTGILEIYSTEQMTLDESLLSRLQDAMPLLGQLLQQSVEAFHNTIDAILKDKFTALQPSVQWKFNKAAWHYFKKKQHGDEVTDIETVEFKNVYPLFGAVDIRNSTIERNYALQEDLKILLTILTKTLQSLKQYIHLSLTDKLVFNCEEWMNKLNQYITANDEILLDTFLETDVAPFLNHIRTTNPSTQTIIDDYFAAIEQENGAAFEHRRNLETDIQKINFSISQHLEQSQLLLQQSYPCYFSKFRTDGLEYDIYIGQSIVPAIPFDVLYLKNIRLWQVRSMAEIARITKDLAGQLHRPLYTTQMIFIHSRPIDICFRNDERRFDVEGAYNIRYEIIKKRIDKVLVKDTNERLTQPGKIALIYFNSEEAHEYEEYIQYLQEEGFLQNDMEYLDLEELQGVSGLKAFRVGVK